MIQLIRDFFIQREFLEIETPVMSPAVIPEAHIDPVRAEGQFLMASPEIFMKRLLAGGFPKLFQICKTFRKNERGDRHLPEFTLLEWYDTDKTYLDLMDHCQDLIVHIAAGLGLGANLTYQGKQLDLTPPFDRITVHQAFDRHGRTSCDQAMAADCFDEVMGFDIEPCLGDKKPVFLYDYPAPLASLARLSPNNTRLAQRVEFYMAGLELANGFTELTDVRIQRDRFESENKIRAGRGQSPLSLPEKFLTDLESMPEAAGMALGVDRLAMLFCDAPDIDAVVAFPPETC